MNEDIVAIDSESEFEEFDLHKCFSYFNNLCFDGVLDAVCASWSKKLTLSAGICSYEKEGYCNIRLSESLLRYRTIKECKEILLHEMIHAYLFLKKRNRKHPAHGKDFIWHMNRVNEITGLNVTIYHSFHNEVSYYRKHIWRCTGDCRLQPPHFGYIKRSRNIAPGPRDRWWNNHVINCGGTFVKLGENTLYATRRVNKDYTKTLLDHIYPVPTTYHPELMEEGFFKGYFPKVRKGCEMQSEAFFRCIKSAIVIEDNGTKNLKVLLHACNTQKSRYERCSESQK